jgi:hypothetical protein
MYAVFCGKMYTLAIDGKAHVAEGWGGAECHAHRCP